ncbi:hypothetical protein M4I33_03840 [Clostridium sp. LY3-2]|uniref:hypothetical protein n=1 Tax=Clostridium sp. LY3-2 TaxID=2942482 RepID=UPI00215327F1|nr:hypothetical protein [Clostridium sp. LY3-2]MCR6514008.1 hypothetical protein [Clostridium sp. LY3-2]
MKVKLRKFIFNKEDFEDEKYCIHFNIYKNIKFKDKYLNISNNSCRVKEKVKMNLNKLEGIVENFSINSFKVIDCLKEEIEELLLIGEIKLMVVAEYKFSNNKRFVIKKISMPFTEKINIPKDTCKLSTINLEYDITDLSLVKLCENKALVSVTSLIKYRDLYI